MAHAVVDMLVMDYVITRMIAVPNSATVAPKLNIAVIKTVPSLHLTASFLIRDNPFLSCINTFWIGWVTRLVAQEMLGMADVLIQMLAVPNMDGADPEHSSATIKSRKRQNTKIIQYPNMMLRVS